MTSAPDDLELVKPGLVGRVPLSTKVVLVSGGVYIAWRLVEIVWRVIEIVLRLLS